MRREWRLFGPTLFLAGWSFQAVFAYGWGLSAPPPQWLFLAVLAAGALGKGNSAQSLGFFWGLLMDVQTGSLLGAQGWIMAAAGYATGKASRQVDGEKLSAQMLLAFAGTMAHMAALAVIELFFRRSGSPHAPGLGAALFQTLVNLAAAPFVFKAVSLWDRWFPALEGDHVFRS